jgi:hypothetical protein
MRLYSRREGTSAVAHGGVTYTPAADGGFDFPNEVSDQLHRFAIGGEKLWEDSIERQRRLMAEEAARRADPATLLAAVEKLVAQAAETAQDEKPAARKSAA